MKILNKYLKIYSMFLKCSLMNQMEYRMNFLLMMGIESVFLITKLMYAYIVYDTGIVIFGYNSDMIIFYIGTFILMTGIYMFLFYFNFSNISALIRNGDLDLLITKPVSLQFIITMKQVDYGTPIPNIIAGMSIVIYQWHKIGISVHWTHILGYLFCVILGSVIGYCIMFYVQLISFFTVKADAAREITDSLWDINNMPMYIYKKFIRVIGCTMIPIFLVSNVPFLFAFHKMNAVHVGCVTLFGVCLFKGSEMGLKYCMGRYMSASS